MNFWTKLKKPFFVLAPMDDVTDVVFREVVTWTARPDVFFTEFTNVEGLNSKGAAKLLPRFRFTENQRPIVAQIWGMEPENYYQTAKMLAKMGVDGIDINMGCPVNKVVRRGACSGMINNPEMAKKIIEATKKGAGKVPVSVKTRCGTSDWKTEEWVTFLLQQDLASITLHGRIAKELSRYPARWEEIKKAVDIRNQMKSKTLIIGNGDVADVQDGLEKARQSGVDGLMIGRGIFHNMWAFDPKGKPEMTEKEMLELLLKHARLFDQTWGKGKNFAILRRYFKIYVSGFTNASQLRAELMQTTSLDQVEAIVQKYLKSSQSIATSPSEATLQA